MSCYFPPLSLQCPSLLRRRCCLTIKEIVHLLKKELIKGPKKALEKIVTRPFRLVSTKKEPFETGENFSGASLSASEKVEACTAGSRQSFQTFSLEERSHAVAVWSLDQSLIHPARVWQHKFTCLRDIVCRRLHTETDKCTFCVCVWVSVGGCMCVCVCVSVFVGTYTIFFPVSNSTMHAWSACVRVCVLNS